MHCQSKRGSACSRHEVTSTTNLGFLVNKKLCDSTLQHNHSVVFTQRVTAVWSILVLWNRHFCWERFKWHWCHVFTLVLSIFAQTSWNLTFDFELEMFSKCESLSQILEPMKMLTKKLSRCYLKTAIMIEKNVTVILESNHCTFPNLINLSLTSLCCYLLKMTFDL